MNVNFNLKFDLNIQIENREDKVSSISKSLHAGNKNMTPWDFLNQAASPAKSSDSLPLPKKVLPSPNLPKSAHTAAEIFKQNASSKNKAVIEQIKNFHEVKNTLDTLLQANKNDEAVRYIDSLPKGFPQSYAIGRYISFSVENGEFDLARDIAGDFIDNPRFKAFAFLRIVRGLIDEGLFPEAYDAACKIPADPHPFYRSMALMLILKACEPYQNQKISEQLKNEILFLSSNSGPKDIPVIPLPKGFTASLRPYQVYGYSWLINQRANGKGVCLADDMGLGKTVQTLAAILHDYENIKPHKPVLIVCPNSVISNWRKEAARFTPDLRVMVHEGTNRQKGSVFQLFARKAAIVLTSYDILVRDADFLTRMQWRGIVLDEAQNIKNPGTKKHQTACELQADYRLALTGTPIENTVEDLWALMHFLNPGILGTNEEFKKEYLTPIQKFKSQAAMAKLKEISNPLILRRLKTDKSIINDLPEKKEIKVYCSLTGKQAEIYRKVVKTSLEEIALAFTPAERRGIIGKTIVALKQVCNHPALYLKTANPDPSNSGKLARLLEMLDEIKQVGEKALIFTQYVQMGFLVQQHLKAKFGKEALFLHGESKQKERAEMIEKFQSSSFNEAPFFILSLRAGGVGINLTAANHVFHLDRWWNFAVENQATDRAYRIGQEKEVGVYKLLSENTIEEWIDAKIDSKKALSESIIGSEDDWWTQLSNQELLSIWSLPE